MASFSTTRAFSAQGRKPIAEVVGPKMVTIGTRLTRSDEMRAIADAHPNVWCTVGVHPHNAAEFPVPAPEAIAAEADYPK
ncbi:MAG: TatD family hydrolase, partial [Bdellovibrionaceae bacterium]|nr:TatD family hydrolase [Pseudobdellovibrionaceae bacterium]